MVEMAEKKWIKGLTTNPTLMRKAGISNYKEFAREVLRQIPDKPISFEVFSDDFNEMEVQALEIASWGANVFVKIPITNTRSESSSSLIRKLSLQRIQLNITALTTVAQVHTVVEALGSETPSYISVFAGRIADTGRDPLPILEESLRLMKLKTSAELIWASPRELLNIFQADQIGCHVITVTNDILKKLHLVGRDLDAYSLETVKMFYEDGKTAGFSIP